jgi:integrase
VHARLAQAAFRAGNVSVGTHILPPRGRAYGPCITAGPTLNTRSTDFAFALATLLIETGVPLVTVQQLLGHSNITITANIYTHTRLPRQADALGQLDKQLNPETPFRKTRKPQPASKDNPATENGDDIT